MKRRRFLIFVLLGASGYVRGSAFAQAALVDRTMAMMLRVYKDSGRMFEESTGYAKKVDKSTIAPERREEVIADIDAVVAATTDLVGYQRPFTAELNAYVKSVRTHGYIAPEHEQAWARVQDAVVLVSRRVKDVISAIDRLNSVTQALNDSDPKRLLPTLEDLTGKLGSRSLALGKLQQMPPPETPAQIDQLAAIADLLTELRQKTIALRDALQAASRRLKSA